ncbi:G-protein coupled receptor [Tachypleus tridentatus]|uniref:G-protein coupled receptor n=1 Tax=Tachypleus tridentatus TaxID=6853 RepID=UPI003FD4548D
MKKDKDVMDLPNKILSQPDFLNELLSFINNTYDEINSSLPLWLFYNYDHDYLRNQTTNAENSSDSLRLLSHDEVSIKILRYFNIIYVPFIVIFGMLGNILSFKAFFFSRLKLRPSSQYLGCLAISDFGYLSMVLLTYFQSQQYPALNVDSVCKFVQYMSCIFSCWSVWLIVSFTVERFLAVKFPLLRPRLLNPSRARLVISLTALMSALFNSYIILFAGITRMEGTNLFQCDVLQQYESLWIYTNLVDMILTLLIPVILIVSMNFMIGYILYTFHVDHNEAKEATFRHSFSLQKTSVSQISESSRHSPFADINQVKVTRIILLISSVFVILNIPSYTNRVYVSVMLLRESDSSQNIFVFHQWSMLLFYTNFAINFLLYNFSSRLFRRIIKDDFVNLFRKMKSLLTVSQQFSGVV